MSRRAGGGEGGGGGGFVVGEGARDQQAAGQQSENGLGSASGIRRWRRASREAGGQNSSQRRCPFRHRGAQAGVPHAFGTEGGERAAGIGRVAMRLVR